ncbi:MAG TPA: iron-containing redox enzyme family protein [Candidatus Eisenbacteria bacterium]|nr:iron-containing redox enzyme family protein [Candidatus Eisenbacteria bacterium]
MKTPPNGIEALWTELVRMCNEQFQSTPFKRLLGTKFTKARAQHYSIQMAFYVQNRRDCWGYVQGAAPLDVKKLIWQHEEDELIGRKSEGKQDHITLAVKEGEVFGLTAEAFEQNPRLEGGEVCFSAWIRVAQRSWLEAIAASAILEMRNSGELIQGGSLSRRIGDMLERDLGIPMKKQINTAEHVLMDVEHAHLLMQVARKYASSETARKAILRGAAESLMIDRVYRGHLADMLEALPDA